MPPIVYMRDGAKYVLKVLGELFQYRWQNGAVCFHCLQKIRVECKQNFQGIVSLFEKFGFLPRPE